MHYFSSLEFYFLRDWDLHPPLSSKPFPSAADENGREAFRRLDGIIHEDPGQLRVFRWRRSHLISSIVGEALLLLSALLAIIPSSISSTRPRCDNNSRTAMAKPIAWTPSIDVGAGSQIMRWRGRSSSSARKICVKFGSSRRFAAACLSRPHPLV